MNHDRLAATCGFCGTRDVHTRHCKEMRAEIEAENAFERRAAFGKGVKVVNVVTGKKYTT